MSASTIDDFLGSRPGAVWRQRLLWLLLAFALVALVVLVGRFVNGGAPTRYATAPVARDDLRATLDGSGTLQPAGHQIVGAGETGRLGTILVRLGQQVRKGQLLAQLDAAPFQAEIDSASTLFMTRQAALSAAQGRVAESRSRLENYERIRTESGGLAPSAREMALARDDLREAMKVLHAALVETEAARGLIEERQARLSLADIRAPSDGVVLAVPQSGQAVGIGRDEALFEIAAPYSRLRLEIMVGHADADAGAVRVGASAQVRAAAWPSQVFAARVVAMRAARSADASRLILALDVQNPGLKLRPGMPVTVRIDLGLRPNVLIVPEAALRFGRASDAARKLEDRRGEAVYVLGEGNTPRRIAVRVEGMDGTRRALTSPELEPGMAVITGLRG